MKIKACVAMLMLVCFTAQADVLVWHRWGAVDTPLIQLRVSRVRSYMMEASSTRIEGVFNRDISDRLKMSVGLGGNFLHLGNIEGKILSDAGVGFSPAPLVSGAVYNVTPLQGLGVYMYSSMSITAAGTKKIFKDDRLLLGDLWYIPIEIKGGILKRFETVPGEWVSVLAGLSYSHERITSNPNWGEEHLIEPEGFLGWEVDVAHNLSEKLSVYLGVGSLFNDSNPYVVGGLRFY